MHSKFLLWTSVIVQVLTALAAIHERLASAPLGWRQLDAPNNSTVITLSIALRLANLRELEPQLAAVSDPRSAKYGQYLDSDAVHAIFAPSRQTVRRVEEWLNSNGINNRSSDGYIITFTTTVGLANSLLNTTFVTYERGGAAMIRTVEYSVPDALVKFIDFITPTTFFGNSVQNAQKREISKRTTDETPAKRDVDASCRGAISPSCLKQIYNVGNYKARADSGSRVGFGSFLRQSALYSDLFEYERLFDLPFQNFSVTLINGGINNQSATAPQTYEANMDVQIMVGVSTPLPVTEFSTGGSPPFYPNVAAPTPADSFNEPYLPYYSYLLSQPNSAIPQVISNSYSEDEHTVPEYYARRVCNMIGMLGLRGITVLECSGDTGVGAACLSNDGQKKLEFTPQFPPTCPYITGIGGTDGLPESAWVASSGGFSNYFSQAWYQRAAVGVYLDKYITKDTKKYFKQFANFKGRAFPDLSAYSSYSDYIIVYQGEADIGGGTSAAAPAVASLIALLNDARLRAGKSTLGFINPLLYSLGAGALNDITSGGSRGCAGVDLQFNETVEGAGIIPYASWNATTGWDPVTGLGTPNFEKLLRLVLSLP